MGANGQRGMSLLELMIAMSLMAIIMAAAFPLVDQMMARFQMARDHYVAATLCQGRIERARGVPYSDIPLLSENGALIDDFGNSAVPGGRFRRTTTVVPDTPVAGMTTMTVQTQICICSRWGWRKVFHPIKSGSFICRFTDENEHMSFLFTEFQK